MKKRIVLGVLGSLMVFTVGRTSLIRMNFGLAQAAVPGSSPKSLAFDDLMKRLESERKSNGDQAVFASFLKSYWSHLMETYPEWATYVGYPGQNGRLSDNSLARIRADKENSAKTLSFLLRLKREKLSAADALTYDLLVDQMKLAVEGENFPSEFLAMNQLDNSPSSGAQLLAASPRATLADMKDRLARLQALPVVIRNDQERLSEGLKAGITVPFPAMRRLPSDLAKLVPKDVLKSPYYNEMLNGPKDVTPSEREVILSAARQAIAAGIYPAIEELRRFLEKEYLPKTRRTVGLSDLPNGRAWYNLNIREQTTTEMTADQVHELGLREVERLAKELDKIQKEMKFPGTRKAFLAHMSNARKFRFKSADEMVMRYRDVAKRIDGELPRFFGKLPREPYGVKPVPDFMAESNAGAYYEPGAMSAGRAGFFFINTNHPEKQQWWELESLTAHEAVPGHHLQIAISHELDELPELRKHDGYTAFSEGWALYAETLGYEIGLYTRPEMKFGQVTNEIWRAVRLVVDTGLHAKGWSRQKAIDYMKSYIAKDEHDIIVEIDRYIVWPGQALAYKIGQLKFQELRERAKRELGERFQLSAYHDKALDGGALPLRVLETRIDDWIREEKAKPIAK